MKGLLECGSSTSTANTNHQVEADMGSQDKQCQKRGKNYHYTDAEVCAKSPKANIITGPGQGYLSWCGQVFLPVLL